ncbi:transposase [Nodosilinea sp. FACHB-141]|nr:transposase [Nodosilinea sp. FACHB-141]
MVAGWRNRTVVTPMTFEGYCNTDLFDAWGERYLVPELSPGQVVVMDNASFHKSHRTQALTEQAGCTFLFLPPYSPDFNKIEKFWARLKHHLRKTLSTFDHLWDAVDDAFKTLS